MSMELLAPCGGFEQLSFSIAFGANAVYLASEKFGMRAKAKNFKIEEFTKIVDFAHKNNVRVYVTCNILMHDKNLKELEEHFKILADAKVDAFIIGDLGAMAIAKKVAPEVDIHVSTQASVANTQAAVQYAKLGAKRIVLAREMSLDEIAKMRVELDKLGFKDSQENPNSLALEAFVHGAMCMSVSGRCLISSYLTGRSANKGLCTQPCRWCYKLLEEKRPGQEFEIVEDNFGTYIMNSKDLKMIEHLDKLQQAGVSSLKIEGRNKKSLYVATVVNAYRHALDCLEEGTFSENIDYWNDELNNVSHRPYSTGFYFGEAQQSQDYDGYEQNCVHVADVCDCKEQKLGYLWWKRSQFKVRVLCRNRFEEGQTLEALIPGQDIKSVKILDLTECKFSSNKSSNDTNKAAASVSSSASSSLSSKKAVTLGSAKSCKVANHAKSEYIFTSNFQIPAGSLLRSTEFLRTSRKNCQ